MTITMVLKLDYTMMQKVQIFGLDDILVASTRGVPYYAGRHVQILISNKPEIRHPRANELNHNSTGIGQGKV